jgi:hypothetical protein
LDRDIVLRHSDKSGESLNLALEEELVKFKQELSTRFVVGDEPIDELINILQQSTVKS